LGGSERRYEMPWKREGKKVYEKRGGVWRLKKVFSSEAKAEAYRKALWANVKEGGRRR